ncbi:hypothetical protein M9H77_01598 [Catharanthus roseus]|uniref:Uncharacterized protein n=1 Tax=Catharanthus roseus TaxID=4058 RepID=A0ACC0C609_CATRO|nr:hypothetical protein M9H77_01598 [Catharanthus roseus]
MQQSFMLLPLVDRLHCCLVSGLYAIYNTSWVAHFSVIRVATLFLPDYNHCCRMQVLLRGSLGMLPVLRTCTGIWVDANELVGCWSLLEVRVLNAWIFMYFPIFAPLVRQVTEACKPYIQQFPMLGYKKDNKLLDNRLRLDVMTVDEVRWCIPAHPIQPQEAHRPPNNKMYVLRNTFILRQVFRPFHRVPVRMITWVESREYSQWLSLTDSSRYATPGSVGFDGT